MAGQPQPLGDPSQVAAYLGVPELTLKEWRYKGKGPRFVKVGKHVRYRWPDIEDWIRQQSVTSRTA